MICTWLPAKGYETLVEVSNLGEVRKVSDKSLMKKFLTQKGYEFVNLTYNKKPVVKLVHNLVATTFIGERPPSMVIDHINGVRTDNNVTNLRYCTNRENASSLNRKNIGRLSSKYIGVSYYKPTSKWIAQIQINKVHIFIGFFFTEQEASDAYQRLLKIVPSIGQLTKNYENCLNCLNKIDKSSSYYSIGRFFCCKKCKTKYVHALVINHD